MIRIRRVHSTVLPANTNRVEQVKEIFRQNFSAVADYADKIPDLLDNPFKYGYRTVLLVSETPTHRVTGFALLLYFPEINSAYLDYIAVKRDIRGGGLGSLLYEATREYAQGLHVRGLYMEVLPDDQDLIKDPKLLEENRSRLRFYERYGARPIINTAYETPVDSTPAPHLVFDSLGNKEHLSRAECQAAIKLILRRKYSHLVTAEYVQKVVASVKDDPVQFRPPRYVKPSSLQESVVPGKLTKSFSLVVTYNHDIHHVRERGYVERPARVDALREALHATGLFTEHPYRHYSEQAIRAVHSADFVTYLKNVCGKIDTKQPIYPYVFPIRRPDRRPKDLPLRAGYYCIDTFTPLDANAYSAARAAVNTALTATEQLLEGSRMSYALCRPPGHHAERRVFGGFCYFNNAAVAAHRLSQEGKVALLDIDFHHGNGSQDIFYDRSDVLTVSIHGHPNFAYPYFSGFSDELGEGAGRNFNRNFPLPENTDEASYLATLQKALQVVNRFRPDFLVLSIGFDTMKGDPTGGFLLNAKSYELIGKQISELRLPTLAVQEGGYSLRNLKTGVSAFVRGFAASLAV